MIGYCFQLAFSSLRRNVWLAVLIVVAVGAGIGSSMTMFTLLRALGGDPIPGKSATLFRVEMDTQDPSFASPDAPPNLPLFSYTDAVSIVKARQATRQAAMYTLNATIAADDPAIQPFIVAAHATQADFFSMFDVTFRSGRPWSAADDEARANVIVIAPGVADRLLPGIDAVGRTLRIDGRDFQIVGVTDGWAPLPRFYAFSRYLPGADPELFLPLETANEQAVRTGGASMRWTGPWSCSAPPVAQLRAGYKGFVDSGCVWIELWVELPTLTATRRFTEFLGAYASERHRTVPLPRKPPTRLYDVREWLANQKAVPDEYRVAGVVAFGFLLVCLVNAAALMLARFTRRSSELAIRRALGANRGALFGQCLAETAVIGAFGGLLGLLLTLAGLHAQQASLPPNMQRGAQLDLETMILTIGVATLATLLAGLYPAWYASRARGMWQLKAS